MMKTNDDKNDDDTPQCERAATHGREGAAGKAPVTRGLPIRDIVIDDTLQVRAEIDGGTVKRYADAMRAGVTFPPVKVARINGAYVLVGGWHRVLAAQRVGHTTIEADIVPVEDFETAGWLAASDNLTHGLPLKRREIRAVFRAYVRAKQYRKGRTGNRIKSSREISAELGGWVVHRTVLEWMRQDFPKVYELMSREENSTLKRKERRDPDDIFVSIVTEAIEQALNSFNGIKDPAKRGELIARVRGAAVTMEAAGAWVEPPPLEDEDDDVPF
jgi:hypothetical protein